MQNDQVKVFALTVQLMEKYLQRNMYMENFDSLQLDFLIIESYIHVILEFKKFEIFQRNYVLKYTII